MTIQFQYTPENLQRAHELHYKKFYPLRGRILLFLGILSIWAGVLLLLIQGGGKHFWYSAPLIVYGAIAILIHYLQSKKVGKRAYKKLKDYHDPMEMQILEEAVVIVIREHRNDIPWSEFKKALITEEMILLYPRDTVFFIFPKQKFTREEYAAFSELVKRKVNPVY